MCSVDWGLVGSLIAALGSCGAAIAAVWIATGDRRARKAERLDAAKAQAMLVLLDISLRVPGPEEPHAFVVAVRNLGAEPVLNVGVDSARFAQVPDATFVLRQDYAILKVVEPQAEAKSFEVRFADEKGKSAIPGRITRLGWREANAEPSDLDVTIRFMDAHGHHWLRSVDEVTLLKRRNAL
jgi:hypothetical protein